MWKLSFIIHVVLCNSEEVGIDWNTLQMKMNKEFDWKKAFLQAMNSKDEGDVEKVN